MSFIKKLFSSKVSSNSNESLENKQIDFKDLFKETTKNKDFIQNHKLNKPTFDEDLIVILNQKRNKLNVIFREKDINKRKDLIENEFDENYKNYFEKIRLEIIKKVNNDTYTKDDINKIQNTLDRDFIFKRCNAHFEKTELLKLVEVNEVTEKDNSEKFQELCESVLSDGLLTEYEKNELLIEKDILGISDGQFEIIFEKVKKEKERYVLEDLIISIILNFKNEFTLDELSNEFFKKHDNFDLDKSDLKSCLNNDMRDHIKYDYTNNIYQYSNDEIKLNYLKEIKFGSTIYQVEIIDDNPYTIHLDTFFAPAKNKCIIKINSNNGYFNNHNIDESINDLILDGITQDTIRRLSRIKFNTFLEYKNNIARKLNLS